MSMAVGRPPSAVYSIELARAICDRLANGEALRAICAEDGMPTRQLVMRWLDENEGFRTIHARARLAQADVMDERCWEIAEGALSGQYDPNAARVAIGALQWRAARLAPKKYGDKLEVSGNAESPLTSRLEVVFVGTPGLPAAPQAPAIPEAVQRALPQVIEATATRVEDEADAKA